MAAHLQQHATAVFVGAVGMLVGALGLAATFVDSIPSLIPITADALAALLFLAVGIAWAVAMKAQSCTPGSLRSLYNNALLNQGCPPDSYVSPQGLPYCYVAGDQSDKEYFLTDLWPRPLKGICQKAFANEMFQLVGCVMFLVLIGLGFLQAKRRARSLASSLR